MSVIALIGWVRVPTLYHRTSELQACNAALVGYAPQRLPTDSIGTFTLTLNNIVPGSVVQIETVTGLLIHNGISATSVYSILIDTYSLGSPLNDLRIKVRKSSTAPFYIAWETLVSSVPGSQSIYVSQIPD